MGYEQGTQPNKRILTGISTPISEHNLLYSSLKSADYWLLQSYFKIFLIFILNWRIKEGGLTEIFRSLIFVS